MGRSQRFWLRSLSNVVMALMVVVGLMKMFSQFQSPHEAQISEPQPVIRKVTMVYGNRTSYYRGLKTHEDHSLKFGYPMTVLRKPILGGYWSKPAILLSALIEEMEKPEEDQAKWLFWFDGDTVLMNPNIPLDIFLPPPQFDDTHLLMTSDWNGMNNGVFFIRVNQWAIELLSATLAYPTSHPEASLLFADQSAMDNVILEHEYFRRSIVFYPLRWFNAYPRNADAVDLNPDRPVDSQVHHGDLLVHFPGAPPDRFDEIMDPYLKVAEAHTPEWELPLQKTGYMKEITDFWRDRHELLFGETPESSDNLA
ncbi:galactosyl transferase GMA12/MNN10 family protein [Aspergillus costaricaensis CBS 115574]|uniref:Galactosyl transferase GMA12/MNN10 family protein n=1 Tax=Aspergillus costaricaensis CBS 115574 TaxID=1448317 RepID=A0ACD1IIA9_9EURO|nr:galactosyl transferase GMA12/MNN10 family protein [Aspergillus costaricaensis CBS 115574]RAK89833.1 galactosyl transferase GMA12/MNN10 family protein [Aspergillus costaricaensis CBS 115574]